MVNLSLAILVCGALHVACFQQGVILYHVAFGFKGHIAYLFGFVHFLDRCIMCLLDVTFTFRPDGQKKAYVRLAPDYDALDVANKVCVGRRVLEIACELWTQTLYKTQRFIPEEKDSDSFEQRKNWPPTTYHNIKLNDLRFVK